MFLSCPYLLPRNKLEVILPLFVYERTESLYTAGCARCVLSTPLSGDGPPPLWSLGWTSLKLPLHPVLGTTPAAGGLSWARHGITERCGSEGTSGHLWSIQIRGCLKLDPASKLWDIDQDHTPQCSEYLQGWRSPNISGYLLQFFIVFMVDFQPPPPPYPLMSNWDFCSCNQSPLSLSLSLWTSKENPPLPSLYPPIK